MNLLNGVIIKQARVGFSDIYHQPVQRRNVFGSLYIFLFGTPQLGVYCNGVYLRRVLAHFSPKRILDAGCGDGTFTFYMAKRFPEASVLGVDIGEQGLHTSESTLDICNRIQGGLQCPNAKFEKLNLLELEVKNQFDFVFSFDVLEHIRENRRVIENIYRALEPGGLFLFRIPNRVEKRILNPKYTADFEKWAQAEHVGQHYDMDSLLNDCREIGFHILSNRYTNGTWGRLAFEISQGLRQYHRVPDPVYFAVVPVLKLMCRFDSISHLKSGDGLLVLAEKPGNLSGELTSNNDSE